MQPLRPIFMIFTAILLMAGSNFLLAQEREENGVFIVNKSVSEDSLTQSDIQKIYFGKMQRWDNNLKVQACLLSVKSGIGERFMDEVLETSPRKFKREWMRRVFSGTQPPPPSFSNPQDVIDYVSERDGGIGFIPESLAESLENCKVLKLGNAKSF